VLRVLKERLQSRAGEAIQLIGFRFKFLKKGNSNVIKIPFKGIMIDIKKVYLLSVLLFEQRVDPGEYRSL